MFHEFCQIDSGLNSIGDTLDDDSVVLVGLVVQQLPSSLEVAANTDTSSNTDLVLRKGLLLLLDSSVCLSHIIIMIIS